MKSCLILPFVLCLLLFGCSSDSQSPTTPNPVDDDVSINLPLCDDSGTQVIFTGTMDIDKALKEYYERQGEGYLNVTPYVGSYFSYSIDNFIPPDIFEISLRLENPTALQAFDACIVFEDLHGKEILNPDSYIDIFDPNDLDPFIAFSKDDPDRVFPPYHVDFQPLFIRYSGGTAMVDYFIIASLPDQTGGVVEITDWTVDGILTPTGGTANLSLRAFDHQDDVTAVVADTSQFTGDITSFTPASEQFFWEATINHTSGQPVGEYPVIVMASSTVAPAYQTYNIFTLIIEEDTNELNCIIFTNPDPPEVEQGEMIEFDATGSFGTYPIISYEWDFDYDNVTFTTDSTDPYVVEYLCEPGLRTVALRITDNQTNSKICSIDVFIIPDNNPTSGWGEDELLVDIVVAPILHKRAIATYQDDVYLTFNSIDFPASGKSQNILFIKSTDRGETWGPWIEASSIDDSFEYDAACGTIAVNQSTGDIYIAFDSRRAAVNVDVLCVRSLDGGDTWSDWVMVNHDVAHSSVQGCCSMAINDTVSPAHLFIAYENWYDQNDFAIHVATTTDNNFTNWANQVIDDSTLDAHKPSIAYNHIDNSVQVTWMDYLVGLGNGDLMFDKSVDNGTAWGTDTVIFHPTGNLGADRTSLAIHPVTGIPGVLCGMTNYIGTETSLKFFKANNTSGSSWTPPVELVYVTSGLTLNVELDVSKDGHWVAFTDPRYLNLGSNRAFFYESLDDGFNWSTGTIIDDYDNVYCSSMVMDDCEIVHTVFVSYSQPQAEHELYYDSGQ